MYHLHSFPCAIIHFINVAEWISRTFIPSRRYVLFILLCIYSSVFQRKKLTIRADDKGSQCGRFVLRVYLRRSKILNTLNSNGNRSERADDVCVHMWTVFGHFQRTELHGPVTLLTFIFVAQGQLVSDPSLTNVPCEMYTTNSGFFPSNVTSINAGLLQLNYDMRGSSDCKKKIGPLPFIIQYAL